jgi:hypothetical protein
MHSCPWPRSEDSSAFPSIPEAPVMTTFIGGQPQWPRSQA